MTPGGDGRPRFSCRDAGFVRWDSNYVAMSELYTKKGKPLQVHGDDIFDRNGVQVGRRRGDKIYGPDGRYAGTIVGDRVVYRSTQRGSRGSAFAPKRRVGIARANRVASALSGDEPFE
jgi:hypothetical protein